MVLKSAKSAVSKISLFIFLLSPTFSTAAYSSTTPTATTRKSKGELEIDPYSNNGGGNNGGGGFGTNTYGVPTSTLALNVPPQTQGQVGQQQPNYNSWESQTYQTNGPAPPGPGARPGSGARSNFNFINPNAFRSKGDDGINDTRGTVRYNILPNGYMARGIITNAADDSAPYTQASVPEEHTDSYPIPQTEEDEED